MNYIYCYTNKITNRKYVGQTNNIERRRREHRSASNNTFNSSYNDMFHRKLREYGEENFIFSILEELDTQDQTLVDQQEKYWIEELQTLLSQKGYNMTSGGQGCSSVNRILSDSEIDQLINDIKIGISYEILNKKYFISISYISMINHGLCFKKSDESYPLYSYYKQDSDYQELVDLLLYSDYTLKEISEKLNLGYSTVKKINYGTLRKGLVENYPIRQITPQQRRANRVKEMLLQKASDRENMFEVGVSKETIKRINYGETNKDLTLVYPLR